MVSATMFTVKKQKDEPMSKARPQESITAARKCMNQFEHVFARIKGGQDYASKRSA
ncbi:hypothetical protein [uncultured Bartonella sp.]|uniref:hypothetical protein n=1 Tax=uncultured Bartonella sp. TaxID=104108 RepID=UPI00261ED630|nr:hypothetical protein [uncultured Bartonella sp.]